MKKLFPAFVTVLVMFLATSVIAQDKVVIIPLNSSKPQALAQIDFSSTGGANSIFDSITMTLNVIGSTTETVFSLLVTESSLDQTYKYDRKSNSNFDSIAVLLTNGENDSLYFEHELTGGGGGSISSSEQNFIKGGITGKYDPDFIGSKIDHALVHVNRIQMSTPGSNPNGDGNWTDYNFEIRVIFMGFP